VVVAQAPCRVDLAGGTLDLWPLYLFHPGAVTVNFAVNVLTRCRIAPLKGKQIRFKSIDGLAQESFSSLRALCRARRFRHPLAACLARFFSPQGGIFMETNSESPAGAGIGASSALMVASIGALCAFTGRSLSREEMRVLAQNVEAQLIGVPTGCQDYYPALYGGVNAIHLDADGIHRQAVVVAPEEIEKRFLLVYTGAPRQSGINNWEVFKAHINGDRLIFRNFEEIGEIARGMHAALALGNWEEVARLLRAEWTLRRTNAPGISTPLIEKLVAEALGNGARAAKVCGAGGGGCLVIFVEAEAKARVADVARGLGARVLPFRVAVDGLSVAGRGRDAD